MHFPTVGRYVASGVGIESMAANRYPVVIYLNQKYALDILAMMEGGFSGIETLTSTRSSEETQDRKVTGGIGFENVFGLLGVSLGSDRTKSDREDQATEVRTEKVHTPNSLFAKMRERLHAEKLIRMSEVIEAKPGDFIEFNVTLQKNSLVHAIEILTSFMQTAVIFAEPQAVAAKKGHPQKVDSNRATLDQLEKLSVQLNAGATPDLMGTAINDPEVKVIVTLDHAFLRDESMSDLIDGEYTVLGKVTRVLPTGSSASINLLRKTSLGIVKSPVLDQMSAAFSKMQDTGITVPEVVTEVKGPAIQVIPLAIFS